MREWATVHGASVRQRGVRQETTMTRAGTLPEYLYQKEIQVGEKINLSSTIAAMTAATTTTAAPTATTAATFTTAATTYDLEGEVEEQTEYDSGSDEETEIDGEGFAGQDSGLGNQQVTRDVDFLVGVTSRFGRPVRFNSRFVL